MERRIYRFIIQNRLLQDGDSLTVALSGGVDSVALLWLLRALGPRLGISLRAAHFHHGIRGAEADRDAAFCEGLCRDWGIPFVLGRGDVPARVRATGESPEEAARVLRYDFLEGVAPGLIATAHNADDNAETLLLHLLRGTGPRGLGGIAPRQGRRIRPLLCCERGELQALLDREDLPHVEDSSNQTDHCLRNRLRRHVMPLLRAENPSLSRTLGRTAALVRAEDAYLAALAREADARCRAGAGWSAGALLGLDRVLRRRVLTAALWDLGLEDPSLAAVERLEALLEAGPSARAPLPGGFEARREYDLLLLGRPTETQTLPELELRISEETLLPGPLGRLRCFVTKNSNFSKKNLTTFALKYDMIAPRRYRVRGRRPGDRLRLPGGTKSLKALMIDRKLPASRRDAIPVLTVDGQIAAVFQVGADPAFLAAPGEEALVVEYISDP